MPASPETEDSGASASASISSQDAVATALVEAGEESEENKSYVRGYNGERSPDIGKVNGD